MDLTEDELLQRHACRPRPRRDRVEIDDLARPVHAERLVRRSRIGPLPPVRESIEISSTWPDRRLAAEIPVARLLEVDDRPVDYAQLQRRRPRRPHPESHEAQSINAPAEART